jgi:hypothetical protein
MTYKEKILGNYSYIYRGVLINSWIVYGNETLCVSLDGFKGIIEIEGNFNYLDNLKSIGIGAEMIKRELLKNKDILDKLVEKHTL